MTEDELQHMKQTLNDVCGVLLRLQIDLQAKDDLRDKFAMAALTSMLDKVQSIQDSTFELAASYAYRFADAMLEARK